MVNTLNSSPEPTSNKLSFGTIRKAVQNSAERLADMDGKKRPKKKHYEETFQKFRELKKTNPQLLEKKIIATAKDKDLKDEMGPDLYSSFQMIRVKVSTMFSRRIREAVQQMNNEQDYYPVESRTKLLNSLNEIIGEMSVEIKKEPLIRNSFSTEREKKLLDKAISQTTSSILAILPDMLTQEQRLNEEKKTSRIFGYQVADDLKKQLLETKPSFGTIRKAIKGAAEGRASLEFLDAPEQRHIDDVISNYKFLREFSPQSLGKLIKLTALGKEFKDILGPDLNDLFNQIWDKELTATMKEDIDTAMSIVYKTKYATKEPTDEEEKKELSIVVKRYFEAKFKQLRKDPRIIVVFNGIEGILDRLSDFVMLAADVTLSLTEGLD